MKAYLLDNPTHVYSSGGPEGGARVQILCALGWEGGNSDYPSCLPSHHQGGMQTSKCSVKGPPAPTWSWRGRQPFGAMQCWGEWGHLLEGAQTCTYAPGCWHTHPKLPLVCSEISPLKFIGANSQACTFRLQIEMAYLDVPLQIELGEKGSVTIRT